MYRINSVRGVRVNSVLHVKHSHRAHVVFLISDLLTLAFLLRDPSVCLHVQYLEIKESLVLEIRAPLLSRDTRRRDHF